MQLTLRNNFSLNIGARTSGSEQSAVKRSLLGNRAYDIEFIPPSQFVSATSEKEVIIVDDEQTKNKSVSVPKVAGVATSGAAAAYGGYSVATNSLMDRNWAWLLIILGLFVALCFLVAKSDGRSGRRGSDARH